MVKMELTELQTAVSALTKTLADYQVELLSLRNANAALITELNDVKLSVPKNIQPNTAVVVDTASSIPLPVFNPNKTLPDTFIEELEEYFNWKNVPQSAWLNLLSRVFVKNSNLASWWTETKVIGMLLSYRL